MENRAGVGGKAEPEAGNKNRVEAEAEAAGAGAGGKFRKISF